MMTFAESPWFKPVVVDVAKDKLKSAAVTVVNDTLTCVEYPPAVTVKADAIGAPWRTACAKVNDDEGVTVKLAVPLEVNVTVLGVNDNPPPLAGAVTVAEPVKPLANVTLIPKVVFCPGATLTVDGPLAVNGTTTFT
jgi:hypothetical protein